MGFGNFFFRSMEVWLTMRLLRSPAFHRGVRFIHNKLHEVRHGKDPAEMGGTKIDSAEETRAKRFIKYYIEELKDQLPGRGSNKNNTKK